MSYVDLAIGNPRGGSRAKPKERDRHGRAQRDNGPRVELYASPQEGEEKEASGGRNKVSAAYEREDKTPGAEDTLSLGVGEGRNTGWRAAKKKKAAVGRNTDGCLVKCSSPENSLFFYLTHGATRATLYLTKDKT